VGLSRRVFWLITRVYGLTPSWTTRHISEDFSVGLSVAPTELSPVMQLYSRSGSLFWRFDRWSRSVIYSPNDHIDFKEPSRFLVSRTGEMDRFLSRATSGLQDNAFQACSEMQKRSLMQNDDASSSLPSRGVQKSPKSTGEGGASFHLTVCM